MGRTLGIQQILGRLLLAVMVTVVLSTVVNFWVLGLQASDGIVINLAGRQRMLSQRMVKEALLLMQAQADSPEAREHAAALGKTTALFERSLGALESGDAELSVPKTKAKPILALLQRFRVEWTAQHALLSALQKGESLDSTRRQLMLEQANKLLASAQAITMGFEAQSQSKIVRLKVLLLASLALVFGMYLLSLRNMRRHIILPTTAMIGGMAEISRGNFEVGLPVNLKATELNEMAQAVEIFRRNGLEVMRLEAEQREHAAIENEQRRVMRLQLAADFESSVGRVVQAVGSSASELQGTAQLLSVLSDTTSSQAGSVAAAAEEGSTNLNAVAAAGDQLAASILEISRHVHVSSEIARRAVSQGEATDRSIAQLSNSVLRIGDVVMLIKSVAEKTNLLALNATIEAARAGEAGRGFAVVAEEVKSLAAQTTHATEEIAGQISTIRHDMEQAVESLHAIAGVIRENDDIVTAIASAIEEQGATTREITGNVDQVALGTQEITRSISALHSTAGENGEASGQVLRAALDLTRQASTLQVEMNTFLDRVRAC